MTTALGTGVLAASPLAASQQSATTAAITITDPLVVSILVVPPTIAVWGTYRNMRMRSTTKRHWEELDEAIEGIHRHHEQERDRRILAGAGTNCMA